MKRNSDAPIRSVMPDRRHKGIVLVLIAAAFVCLMVAVFAGGDVTTVSAQISPLSPLYAVGSDSPAITFIGVNKFNVMASGQAALTRLSLVLAGIIVGAGVFVWRRP